MKYLRKITAITLILSFCILTACSGAQPPSGASSSAAASGTSSAQPSAAPEKAFYVNPSGFPVVNEPITLTVFGSQDQNHIDWQDMWFWQKTSEMSGITFDLQQVPAQGFDEKKNLVFASNDLPDIFYRADINRENIAQFGVMSKQLLPLESYLEEFAPNFYKLMQENPAVEQSIIASDGHIYIIPALDNSSTGRLNFKQFINKEWLAKLDLRVPTTPEELKEVLIAFRDKDPNGNSEKDEIPLGIREISSIYELGGSWGLERQFADTVNINDGQVHYWLKDDNFKEYLQFLNSLYSENLLWANYYKADSRPEWRSNLANALFGAFYMPYSDVFINVEDQFIGFDPLVGPHGDQTWAAVNSGVQQGGFALSATCKYPEAALRWVDYFYSDEGSIFFRYGIEGETFTYDEAGVPRINDNILTDPDGFMTALGRYNLVPGGGPAHLITDNTDGIVASDLVRGISKDLYPFIPKNIYTKPAVAQEDQERVNAIVQDLNKYRDESVTKFIIGEWSFDQWDAYCSTLDRIGLPELEKIYQKAFDAIQ